MREGFSRQPRLGEHEVERDAQRLGAVHMPICDRIRNDRLSAEWPAIVHKISEMIML